ncbi:DUF6881 domain-containing protein [Actinokineospora pegani]|uniref:DUF6881 domain-containing protein n=1 Tax=Actinokineospora pegani TaxID=2654637 RepID=UPI0012EA4C4A|nr:hypothetical protein [Actinokineospora pegani]
MRYVKVQWRHDNADEPMVYLSELDDSGYEVRKVQVYPDGRLEFADSEIDTDTIGLSDVAFPSVAEISEQEDCSAKTIDCEEFETFWRSARLSRNTQDG